MFGIILCYEFVFCDVAKEIMYPQFFLFIGGVCKIYTHHSLACMSVCV